MSDTSPIPTFRSSATSSASPVPESARNDLRTDRAERTLKSGAVDVKLAYVTRLSTADWSARADKPLSVSLTAVNRNNSAQKIYLSRVTTSITANDDSGPLESPKALVDTANISPGFIVKSPYTYEQNFVIPAVNDEATSLSIAFTYELLFQASKNSDDFYKKSVVDTLLVPLAG